MILVLKQRKTHWFPQIKNRLIPLTLASLIYGVSVITAFYGFSSGPLALNVAIFNTRTFIIFIISYLIFKDKPTKFTLIGSLITIFGVLITKTA
jgi:drug/metabolite transporter (DMT)-like permease